MPVWRSSAALPGMGGGEPPRFRSRPSWGCPQELSLSHLPGDALVLLQRRGRRSHFCSGDQRRALPERRAAALCSRGHRRGPVFPQNPENGSVPGVGHFTSPLRSQPGGTGHQLRLSPGAFPGHGSGGGGVAPTHYSLSYVNDVVPLAEQTAPAILENLRQEGVTALFLVPV